MAEESKNFTPYDKTHRIRRLFLVTTIVPDGQENAIIELNQIHEAAICFTCYGKGTSERSMSSIFNISPKRDIVFSIIREDQWISYKIELEKRFSVSRLSKGVAFASPLDAVAGVSIYKMLSNTRNIEKPILTKKRRKKE